MMKQADKIYKKFFRKNFSNFDANFPPSNPIELGAFGTMEKGFFKSHGNIYKDFKIHYEIDIDELPSKEIFKTDGSVSVKSLAKGEIGSDGLASIKAQVELSFSSKKSLYFSCNEIRYNKISNLREVGNAMISLYKSKDWDKNYVVVTSVMEAGKTLVLISGSNNGQVVIGAKSDTIPSIDFANLAGDIEIKSSSNVAYEILTDQCQLGFGISRVTHAPLGKVGIKSIKGMRENIGFPKDEKLTEEEEYVFEKVKPGTYDEKDYEKTFVQG